jgi:hypothetical protein
MVVSQCFSTSKITSQHIYVGLYLEKSLNKARSVSQKEKLQMLYWLKCGLVKQHQEFAQRLERNLSTISRWLLKT